MAWNYKDWYHNKGGKQTLARKRRKKYRTDASYRKTQKDNSTNYYRTRKRKIMPSDRTSIQSVDGKRYFSIGRVARMLGRKVVTIRQYHESDVLPSPTFFDGRGWRLYTKEQVGLMRDTFQKFDKGEIETLAAVSRIIARDWRKVNAKG